jgi:hypothetical protein
MEKNSIYFNKNTGEAFKTSISSSARISSDGGFEKYLGLPVIVGQSKIATFADIIGRVEKKLDGWNERFLSQAGKEILIKAIVQAIPTYTMGVFQLLKALCKRLNSLISRFWWGNNQGTAKKAWLWWEDMRKSKASGGMGFRDLEVFNLALLAKQGWRLIQQPESLVAQIMRDKYYRGCDFMDASKGKNISYAWRSILNAQEVLDMSGELGMGSGVG